MATQKDIIDDRLVISYAETLTPISEIAILLDISVGQAREMLSPETYHGKLYWKTVAMKAMDIRKSNIELADAGSPSAADHVQQYLNRIYNDEG